MRVKMLIGRDTGNIVEVSHEAAAGLLASGAAALPNDSAEREEYVSPELVEASRRPRKRAR